jgi:cytochrome P450
MPAAYGMPRVATEDVDLPSGTVRRGETVFPLLARANRDPEVFPEPAAFDPNHPPASTAHFCLGARLARLEVTTVLSVLLAEFPALAPKSLPVHW